MECRGQPASVTCERSSASAQARPDPHGSTTGTSISHISTAGALLNAQSSHGRCRDALKFPGCLFLTVFIRRFCASAELLVSGRCCIPVFGLLSSDPEAADGPQGPVTPCQDQSQLNGQGVFLPSCCTGVQTAGLGFAGTARWIFQFIFLYLFP